MPPYSLHTYAPEAQAGLDVTVAGSDAPWIARIQAADGTTYLMSVRPVAGTALSLDAALVQALVADMLRPGWIGLARILTRPIIAGQVIYRGFSLERETGLPSGAGERWAMTCLIPKALADEFDWAHIATALDAFHVTVFGEEGSDA